MRFVCLLFLAFGIGAGSARAVEYKPPTRAEIAEAQQAFKFRGQWIHPKIVKEFQPWESDHELPLILAIDVAAATGTNRYFGDVDSSRKNTATWKEDQDTFSYEWIGRLKNGMHVLVTRSSGGGTMVSTDLNVFRLEEREGLGPKGKYPQLVLELERTQVLGDRGAPEISLQGNEVRVRVKSALPNAPEKDFTLSF